MKTLFLVLSFALLIASSAACAVKNPAGQPQFHPPQTEAEKALDHILMLDQTDRYLASFVFKVPERALSRDKKYSRLFTQGLQNAWEKSFKSSPLGDDGTMHYVDINFITCAQDAPKKYLYATGKDDGHEAYIEPAWPEFVNNPVSPPFFPYRMIKEDGAWKLDGVKCPDGFLFNTDFHYTR